MPDINDAANHLINYPKSNQEWQLDGCLVQLKREKDYQQVFLFFADELQEKLKKQPMQLLELLQLNSEVDSRFALIYHPEHQFGLQAFFSAAQENLTEQESKVSQKLASKMVAEKHAEQPKQPKQPKTSFSAQALHLFLEMDNHSQATHSEQNEISAKPVQKPFLAATNIQNTAQNTIQKNSRYENPCFNILEEMIWQADFIGVMMKESG